MTTKTEILSRYRYRYKGGGNKEGIGLFVQRCCLDTSLALALASAAKTTVLAEIVLSDMASRAKARSGAGSSRRTTTKNMTTGG